MYVLSYCTIKDKQRNIISFLSSSRKTATWQFTNRPLLIKLYRVIVFVQISMKFFFPWKAFLMYYSPSNKFFTHLYHNSRHNCLKKCSVFFCAMVISWEDAKKIMVLEKNGFLSQKLDKILSWELALFFLFFATLLYKT